MLFSPGRVAGFGGSGFWCAEIEGLIVAFFLNGFCQFIGLVFEMAAKMADAGARRRAVIVAEIAFIAAKELLLAFTIEVNAAGSDILKIGGGEDVLIEEVQGQAVNQAMAEFFEQVEGEAGPAIFSDVVEAGVGIEADAVEQGLQLVGDDGLLMAD